MYRKYETIKASLRPSFLFSQNSREEEGVKFELLTTDYASLFINSCASLYDADAVNTNRSKKHYTARAVLSVDAMKELRDTLTDALELIAKESK